MSSFRDKHGPTSKGALPMPLFAHRQREKRSFGPRKSFLLEKESLIQTALSQENGFLHPPDRKIVQNGLCFDLHCDDQGEDKVRG